MRTESPCPVIFSHSARQPVDFHCSVALRGPYPSVSALPGFWPLQRRPPLREFPGRSAVAGSIEKCSGCIVRYVPACWPLLSSPRSREQGPSRGLHASAHQSAQQLCVVWSDWPLPRGQDVVLGMTCTYLPDSHCRRLITFKGCDG